MEKKKEVIPRELTLLERITNDKHCHPQGRFACFCGKEFIARLYDIKRGATKSCGCYRKALHTIHGGGGSRIYTIYTTMLRRCLNTKSKLYKYYGKRGITACDEWKEDFLKFQSWALANGYQEGLSIDRINNDGNYEPNNCRWVSSRIQGINKKYKNEKEIGFRGVRPHHKKWKASLSIHKKTIFIGCFSTPEEASAAYERARKERNEMYYKEEGLL